MKRIAIAALFVVAGCAANPVPDGYSGPVAKIADSTARRSGTSVDFFVLEKFNGSRVDNAVSRTTQDNAGNGFAMTVEGFRRPIPAVEAKFHIKAVTHYAAPVLTLMNTVYEIDGDVRFVPQPDHYYEVKGTLGEKYSAVWVEDAATGQVMDHKIEINGSSAQSLFQK